MLSVAQQALWFLHRLEPDSTAYHIIATLRIRGPLDAPRLQRAADLLATRHDALRTSFVEHDGTPARVVRDRGGLPIEVRELPGAGLERLTATARELLARPLSIEDGQVCRLWLLRAWPDDALLVMAAHHIATDASSGWVLLRDLFSAYQGSDLPPLTGSFEQYVAQERELLDGTRRAALAAYWDEVCAGSTAAELPADQPRRSRPALRGATYRYRLPDAVAQGVRAAAAKAGVTPFALLLGAFQATLYRYTGRPDVLVGCSTTMRRGRAMRDVVGYLVNVVLLRSRLDRTTTFIDAARQVAAQIARGLAHAGYPFPMMAGRGPDGPVQVTFTMIGFDPNEPLSRLMPADGPTGDEVVAGDLRLTQLEVPQMEGQFDLSVELRQTPGALTAVLRYRTERYDEATIARFARHFGHLAAAAVAQPQAPIAAADLMGADERQQVLAFGNYTSAGRGAR